MKLFKDLVPVCLYTYETCSSRDRIIELEPTYKEVESVVTEYFGHKHMDNKITLVFKAKKTSDTVFATYWDGKLSIGFSAHFFNDPNKRGNEYMRVLPIS